MYLQYSEKSELFARICSPSYPFLLNPILRWSCFPSPLQGTLDPYLDHGLTGTGPNPPRVKKADPKSLAGVSEAEHSKGKMNFDLRIRSGHWLGTQYGIPWKGPCDVRKGHRKS